MNLSDLTPEQAAAIGKRILPSLRYLGRLADRMQQSGFAEDDPVYVAARQAHHGLHALRVHLHYRACGTTELTSAYPAPVTSSGMRETADAPDEGAP